MMSKGWHHTGETVKSVRLMQQGRVCRQLQKMRLEVLQEPDLKARALSHAGDSKARAVQRQ